MEQESLKTYEFTVLCAWYLAIFHSRGVYCELDKFN